MSYQNNIKYDIYFNTISIRTIKSYPGEWSEIVLYFKNAYLQKSRNQYFTVTLNTYPCRRYSTFLFHYRVLNYGKYLPRYMTLIQQFKAKATFTFVTYGPIY